jgi:subfamily B ATP-binding cassette protein MsbA
MSVYTRAMAYFAPDRRWIAALVGLIGISVGVGLLEAWPFAVLIDSVLTQQPQGDWIPGCSSRCSQKVKVGQIVGLVLIGLALQVIGYTVWMARMMINYHLNYRGTTRVGLTCSPSCKSSG